MTLSPTTITALLLLAALLYYVGYRFCLNYGRQLFLVALVLIKLPAQDPRLADYDWRQRLITYVWERIGETDMDALHVTAHIGYPWNIALWPVWMPSYYRVLIGAFEKYVETTSLQGENWEEPSGPPPTPEEAAESINVMLKPHHLRWLQWYLDSRWTVFLPATLSVIAARILDAAKKAPDTP